MRNFAALRCISSEKRFVCRNGLLSPLIIVYFYFAALAGKAYTVSPMARMLPSAREKNAAGVAQAMPGRTRPDVGNVNRDNYNHNNLKNT